MPDATTDKRKRTKAQYYVEDNADKENDGLWEYAMKVDNTAHGKRWIQDHGDDGKRYRVIAVTYEMAEPLKVETVRKVKLA